jgi:spermidine/putrescine transport system substrate-binding protein
MDKQRSRDGFGGKFSRRKFLKGTTATISAVAGFSAVNFLIPKASLGQDTMTKELVLSTWGGSFAEGVRSAIVKPFEEETGVKVHVAVNGKPAEVLAKLKAGSIGGGGSYDVVWEGLSFSYSAIVQGLVEPLRVENIPGLKSVLPTFNKLQGPVPWDPGEDIHGAPAEYVPRGIGYNRDLFPDGLDSLKALWDSSSKAKLGMYTNTQWQMVNACIMSGQDFNNIQDIDKVWSLLEDQHKLVDRYFGNWAEGMELYENGTIEVSPFLGGRAYGLRNRGFDIGYFKPKEGWILNADLLLIGKGSKNRYTAEKFIEFTYRPDIATATSEAIGYPIATKNLIATDIVKSLPDYDPTGKLEGVSLPDPVYWDENMSAWNEKLREIMSV